MLEAIDAEASQEHVIGAAVRLVQLEAIALEPLGQMALARISVGLKRLASDSVTEDWQAAVFLLILAKAAIDGGLRRGGPRPDE